MKNHNAFKSNDSMFAEMWQLNGRVVSNRTHLHRAHRPSHIFQSFCMFSFLLDRLFRSCWLDWRTCSLGQCWRSYRVYRFPRHSTKWPPDCNRHQLNHRPKIDRHLQIVHLPKPNRPNRYPPLLRNMANKFDASSIFPVDPVACTLGYSMFFFYCLCRNK